MKDESKGEKKNRVQAISVFDLPSPLPYSKMSAESLGLLGAA